MDIKSIAINRIAAGNGGIRRFAVTRGVQFKQQGVF